MCALSPPYQRREQHHASISWEPADRSFDFGECLLNDRRAATRTQNGAHASHQQTQIIVDFRNRANGASRVRRRWLLIDCNRWLQPLDAVNVRTLHLVEELPG